MKKNEEFFEALDLLEAEKGIAKEYMYEKIKAALIATVKRDKNVPQECVDAVIDEEKRTIRVFTKKLVVEEIENDENSEITLTEAKKISRKYQIGDYVEYDVDTATVGRIAAKIGKNVIVQAINEAVNSSIIKDFEAIKGTIITGKVRRMEKNKTVFLEYGKYEIPLPVNQQIPGEIFTLNSYVKVLVADIKHSPKGQDIIITRLGNEFIKKLFELEVPEVADGTVEIVSVAREAGSRTKVAVYADPDSNVDPVGACIGQNHARLSAILSNIQGEEDNVRKENIDLIRFYDDPSMFVTSALSPADVEVEEIDVTEKTIRVSVSMDKLSLAIGKSGQNVRLAAKLTGYKIDIIGR